MTAESIREAVERETEPDDDAPDDDPTDVDAQARASNDEAAAAIDAPPAAPPMSMEKQIKAMGNESARHEKRVREILGEGHEDWTDCPLCPIPGFVPPFDSEGPDADAIRGAVAAYFDGGELPYPESTESEVCPTCEGWGQVKTGSKAPNHAAKICTPCGGNGWVMKQTNTNAAAYVPVPGEVTVYPQPDANGQGAPDVFGRPWGHRDYGVLPSLVNG